MSREFPIIFSTPMVRPTLEGWKTQSRRLAYQAPKTYPGVECKHGYDAPKPSVWLGWHEAGLLAPPNGMWGREAWADVNTSEGPGIGYRADGAFMQPEFDGPDFGAGPSYDYDKYPGDYSMWFEDLLAGAPDHGWRPSILMPRWASRLTLSFTTESRLERLQDITPDDCRAEGHLIGPSHYSKECHDDAARDWFMDLWSSLHKPPFTWEDNPSVIVLTFERKAQP